MCGSDVRAVREHLAGVRIHGDRGGAARATRCRSRHWDAAFCSARSRRGQRRCSATPAFRRSSCRSSKRESFWRSWRSERARIVADGTRDERRCDRVLSKPRFARRRRSRSRRSAKSWSSGRASSTSVWRESFSPARFGALVGATHCGVVGGYRGRDCSAESRQRSCSRCSRCGCAPTRSSPEPP